MWISFRCKLGGKVDQFWMQINSLVVLNVTRVKMMLSQQRNNSNVFIPIMTKDTTLTTSGCLRK